MEVGKKFLDIINNPDYYELTDNGKDFFICATEGFISKSKIDDKKTKYLNMHCKCGDAVIRASFSNLELDSIRRDRVESLAFVELAEEAML